MRETQEAIADLAFGKRPAEELYALRSDPHELTNVADRPEHAEAKQALRARLDKWMTHTADPRAMNDDDRRDAFPYYGNAGRDLQK
ncbi:MAG TPA: hypothetical protein VGO90_09880 [Chthoniobacteraceae bacterium]|jgi:N-sulfoglucosamine sulfohydrolase|nr:hypothetical protein [Chthoniobacteraceae bacterium]